VWKIFWVWWIRRAKNFLAPSWPPLKKKTMWARGANKKNQLVKWSWCISYEFLCTFGYYIAK
jgi:hypothetical protein